MITGLRNKMGVFNVNVLLSLFFLLATFDLCPAIEVIDITFTNVTQHNFTVHWGYRLNGYNESRLEGFKLTASDIFDYDVLDADLGREASSYSPSEEVEGGTSYNVCLRPVITDGQGNRSCGFVTTFFDPWDWEAQAACYIGIAIFLVFVVLMVYDIRNPRFPAIEEKQQPRRATSDDRPVDLAQSNMELTQNMY